MSAPQKKRPNVPPPRAVRPPAAAPAPTVVPPSSPRSTELGWLPDLVYTGERFEAELAFFADSLGRITRFSREPADLAAARRLPGQVALPGVINGHSVSWMRTLRGRAETARGGTDDPWRDARERALARLTADELFETARMAFTEMLLSGITCVGEFHQLLGAHDGSALPDPNHLARQILRAAHDVGIRIALFNVAATRGDATGSGSARMRTANVDQFIRNAEALRVDVAATYPSDEAWVGVAGEVFAGVSLDEFKAIAAYAHTQRLRLQNRVASRREEIDACKAEYGRPPVALLADAGLIDKRFTVIHGLHLTEDECRVLGAARATLCTCPSTEQNLGWTGAPVEVLLAAGAGVALGSGNQAQVDLLKDARLLEYGRRALNGRRPWIAGDSAKALFHAGTVAGARSLGATGGALEVGRPADFFTVNLYDASIAGADPDTLLANIVFGLERRAIREVWVGARQRIVGGRHPNQGPIVGRFVDLQRRLWGTPG